MHFQQNSTVTLSAGADVNQELFRGFATTAAAREGHCALLDMLLKAGASQSACEHALLEACLCGQARAAELLIRSEMIGPSVAQHALVSASSREWSGQNCVDRVLLRSVKPALHANIDCTSLVAAVVSRQVSMVKYLLEAGAKTDCYVRLGAWSWDIFSGEELRVGGCLGEPYDEVWCAVEYYEASGKILSLFLQHQISSLESQQQGRTLLCHAILCQNSDAVGVLLDAGADLIKHGCQVDARTETGDTALMVAAKADQADCFLELIIAGADLGLINNNGDSAVQLAKKSLFRSSTADIFRRAIITGTKICSSNLEVFSLLHFLTGIGNTVLLQMILQQLGEGISTHDGLGLTPILVALKAGHTEAFRLLIMAGADIRVKSKDGQTVVSVLQHRAYSDDRNRFEEILLDAMLAHVLTGYSEFKALHFAARMGNSSALLQLLKMGFPINSLDENGYSPLMLAAKEGHADACKLLLQRGADCGIVSCEGEMALSLSRKSNKCKIAEGVILDYLAHSHVLLGEKLRKHTREGRGSPHVKVVRMLKSGLLTWGKSSRRNVVCNEAVAGPSASFLKNRRKDAGEENREVFRVLTETGREIHFEAASAASLELWVRGINLITRDATSGAWLSNTMEGALS
ncbi:Ankyrin-3 [Vitis vinifera]|uniref:Ankyrin-3 n=1 Tax=Vitis vinifera TaxID=29760 RepID=A0A438BV02_VITVI|nr:Ankyrin-3 [Vitis vinifera]